MKALLGALVMVMVMAVLPPPAAAQSRGFGPWLQAQVQGAQSPGPVQREQREMRRDPRLTPDRNDPRSNRLTDQERRDLRRDIDQADREIYRQGHKR